MRPTRSRSTAERFNAQPQLCGEASEKPVRPTLFLLYVKRFLPSKTGINTCFASKAKCILSILEHTDDDVYWQNRTQI